MSERPAASWIWHRDGWAMLGPGHPRFCQCRQPSTRSTSRPVTLSRQSALGSMMYVIGFLLIGGLILSSWRRVDASLWRSQDLIETYDNAKISTSVLRLISIPRILTLSPLIIRNYHHLYALPVSTLRPAPGLGGRACIWDGKFASQLGHSPEEYC